jgi:hypothetical protein
MVIFYSYVSLPNGIHLGVAEKQTHLLTLHAIVDAKTQLPLPFGDMSKQNGYGNWCIRCNVAKTMP